MNKSYQIGRVRKLLKTAGTRISMHFSQMHG